jgi:hypothetical protein
VAKNAFVLKSSTTTLTAMIGRVFFCAENVTVSSQTVTAGQMVFPIQDLCGARTRRVGRWFWEAHEVIVELRYKDEVILLKHRNAYFAYQLVRAIESALSEQRDAAGAQVLSA